MWLSGDAPNNVYKGPLLKFQVESKWFIFSETGMSMLFLKYAKFSGHAFHPKLHVKYMHSIYTTIKF